MAASHTTINATLGCGHCRRIKFGRNYHTSSQMIISYRNVKTKFLKFRSQLQLRGWWRGRQLFFSWGGELWRYLFWPKNPDKSLPKGRPKMRVCHCHAINIPFLLWNWRLLLKSNHGKTRWNCIIFNLRDLNFGFPFQIVRWNTHPKIWNVTLVS